MFVQSRIKRRLLNKQVSDSVIIDCSAYQSDAIAGHVPARPMLIGCHVPPSGQYRPHGAVGHAWAAEAQPTNQLHGI